MAVVLLIAILLGIGLGAQRIGLKPWSAPGPPVARPTNVPPPGLEEAAQPLGTPAPIKGEASNSYRFIDTVSSGAPVAWSPCRPIHYVVRAANQPPGSQKAITQAVAAVSAATGLRFVNDGATDEPPASSRDAYQPARYGDRWAPVLVAWATPAEVPYFGVDVAGEAGPTRINAPDGSKAYVSGTLYLDPAKYQQISKAEGPAAAKAVILHELGHLVGLAHVNDPKQIMFPRGSAKVTAYQSGDLSGLALLGKGPCQPSL
jgi:hypothetical protein